MLLVPAAAATWGWGVTYGGPPGTGGGAGALALAEVPLALTNERLLVPLHPLQLFLRRHSPPRRSARDLQGLCR